MVIYFLGWFLDEILLTHGFVLRWLLFIDYIFDLTVGFILGLCLRVGMQCWYWYEFSIILDYLIFVISMCYLWGSSWLLGFCCLGMFLVWFLYVDHSLSSLHGGSGSLTRYPHGREVVTSYHLGSPRITNYWMFDDAVVHFHSYFYLGDFYSMMYFILSCILYYDVLYQFSHTLRHVQWMLFIGCTFIVLVILMHFLMRLCICYFFVIMRHCTWDFN